MILGLFIYAHTIALYYLLRQYSFLYILYAEGNKYNEK